MARRIIRNEDLVSSEPTKKEKERCSQEKLREIYINSDTPETMENGSATLLYIVIMIIGTIFKARILIYIIASVIYFRFINRKTNRAKEWDENIKNKETDYE